MNFPYFPGIDATSDLDSDVTYLLSNVERALGANYTLDEKKIVQRIRNEWDTIGQPCLYYFRNGSPEYLSLISTGLPSLLDNATTFLSLIPKDGSDFYSNCESFVTDIKTVIGLINSDSKQVGVMVSFTPVKITEEISLSLEQAEMYALIHIKEKFNLPDELSAMKFAIASLYGADCLGVGKVDLYMKDKEGCFRLLENPVIC